MPITLPTGVIPAEFEDPNNLIIFSKPKINSGLL